MASSRRQLWAMVFWYVVVPVVGVVLTLSILWHYRNYAKETARPLEQALIKAGAAKRCSVGDAGHGSDNKTPAYQVTFETAWSKKQALREVTKLAEASGYKLTYQRSPNEHIDKYVGGKDKARLGVSLYSGGSNLGCPGTELVYDASHTAILMSVSLPAVR